jgi:hypothetical protein
MLHVEPRRATKTKCWDEGEKIRTIEHLEHLTKHIIETWSHALDPGRRDYLRSLASHDLQLRNGQMHDLPKLAKPTRGYALDDMIALAAAHLERYGPCTPTFKSVVTALSSDGTRASVWVTSTKSYQDIQHLHLHREVASLFQWRWKESRWQWYAYYSLRGPAAEMF